MCIYIYIYVCVFWLVHLLLKWSVELPICKSNILSLQSNYGLFYTFFSRKASKFVSNTYALTNLTPRTTTPSAPYLPFNRMLLKSHYIFYFSCNSIRYDRRRWENLLNFSITAQKRKYVPNHFSELFNIRVIG